MMRTLFIRTVKSVTHNVGKNCLLNHSAKKFLWVRVILDAQKCLKFLWFSQGPSSTGMRPVNNIFTIQYRGFWHPQEFTKTSLS